MIFRLTKETETGRVMAIIQGAQQYLKDQGINQWQNNYPNPDTINKDIENKNGYILIQNNTIVGTVAVLFTGEPTYDSIYSGNWLTKENFGVIHRIAVDPNYHGLGLATEIIKHVEKLCKDKGFESVRIDTHKENAAMHRLLLKNEFDYCGIIYLEDGDERVAFEKAVKS